MKPSRFPLRGWALAGAVVGIAAAPALAEDWIPVATTGGSVLVEQDTRLRQLDPVLQQLFLPDQDEDVKLTSVVQLFPLDPDLLGVRRARQGRGRASFQCLTPRGSRNLGSQRVRANPDGNFWVSRQIDAGLDCDLFFVEWEFLRNLEIPAGTSIQVDTAAELVDPDAEGSCFEPTSQCLNGDRFQVEVDWRDFSSQSGRGIAFPRTDDSGLFFFFDPDNTELLVKVIDGCAFNDHYWVFYGANTDVEFEVTVTDSVAGQTRGFTSGLGEVATAILDTRAFDTCP